MNIQLPTLLNISPSDSNVLRHNAYDDTVNEGGAKVGDEMPTKCHAFQVKSG